jgi:hypothetical protein
MQDLMTWGVVSALILASSQLGGPGDVPVAGSSLDSGSADLEASSSMPLGSSQILIAGRSHAPRSVTQPPPSSPEPSGSSPWASAAVRTTIVEDDFESETLSRWGASGNGTATVTRSEHFRGQSAVMLKVGPSDPVSNRTEIVIKEKGGRLHANKDYCIRFAFKTKDWSDFPKWVTLFQTHAIPANGDFSCPAGRNSISLISGSGRNLALAVIDKPVARRRGGAIAEVVHSQDLVMDRWYSVQFHYRPAFDDSGIIEAWIDGKKIYSQSGGNMDSTDQCGRPSEPYTNLKLGLYKERGNSGTQSIYFDDFVLAENAECK